MKFLLYNGRHGEQMLTPHDEKHWKLLVAEMQNTDGVTIAEAKAQGLWVDGSDHYHDLAFVSVDDGGEINTIELTEVYT